MELLLNAYMVSVGEDGNLLETEEWWCWFHYDVSAINGTEPHNKG